MQKVTHQVEAFLYEDAHVHPAVSIHTGKPLSLNDERHRGGIYLRRFGLLGFGLPVLPVFLNRCVYYVHMVEGLFKLCVCVCACVRLNIHVCVGAREREIRVCIHGVCVFTFVCVRIYAHASACDVIVYTHAHVYGLEEKPVKQVVAHM